MAGPVASQGAGAVASTLVGVGDAAAGRRDIKGVEIDQVRLGLNAMRVMAGGAGRLLVADVLAVEPVGHEHTLAVALVAQGIGRGAFGLKIHLIEIAFEQRGVKGSVRAVGAGAFGAGALIVVVAIGADHLLRAGPGRNEGAALGRLDGSDHGMVRGVSGIELEAGVGLVKLADDGGAAVLGSFRMAAETDLILMGRQRERGAADGFTLDPGEGAG